jgi:lipoprotein NlpI
MKRCAIFFALLIATLLIAVWSEHRQSIVSEEDVVLGNHGPALQHEVADPLSK